MIRQGGQRMIFQTRFSDSGVVTSTWSGLGVDGLALCHKGEPRRTSQFRPDRPFADLASSAGRTANPAMANGDSLNHKHFPVFRRGDLGGNVAGLAQRTALASAAGSKIRKSAPQLLAPIGFGPVSRLLYLHHIEADGP